MAFIIRRAMRMMTAGETAPKCFPTSGFETVHASEKLEEEKYDDYSPARYYPVNIGEVLSSKYQVVGKLGFGSTSTVWLARDLKARTHVALKIYTRDQDNKDEFEMYQYLRTCSRRHPGYRHVRTALDEFTIPRTGGPHHCIVQKPLWESFKELLARNPRHRFSLDLLKAGLRSTLLALDYLHTECRVIHTDIKADNILQDISDQSILEDFETQELEHPSRRKVVEGSTIYASRSFKLPRTFGDPVLSDFGAAVRGDVEHTDDVQPDVYRCPEVMLQMPWSYPIDIWNLGCVIWDLFEDKHLFYGQDPSGLNPNGTGYTTRAHLAEVVGMLGLPPADLLQRGKRSQEFFTEDGQWCAEIEVPHGLSLPSSEENLEGEQKTLFLDFVRSMLCWKPEDRKTAKQLLDDPWLKG